MKRAWKRRATVPPQNEELEEVLHVEGQMGRRQHGGEDGGEQTATPARSGPERQPADDDGQALVGRDESDPDSHGHNRDDTEESMLREDRNATRAPFSRSADRDDDGRYHSPRSQEQALDELILEQHHRGSGQSGPGRQRTQADVELRLQEVIARDADTLYLTNYSLQKLKSPIMPQVAERLTTLHLNLNLLSKFPSCLLSFRKLVCLNLSSNRIAGPIPEGIGQLTALSKLVLAYNQITSFPATISKMVSLRSLHLEVIKRTRAEPTFMLKWNSIKDSLLTSERQAELERCELVNVPTLLNLACTAVISYGRKDEQVRRLVQDLVPRELQEYLQKTYKCWQCRRRCTGKPPVVRIRPVNLAPRRLPQNRRSLGYWGGDPTATPCMFLFDKLGCYRAWDQAQDRDRDSGSVDTDDGRSTRGGHHSRES